MSSKHPHRRPGPRPAPRAGSDDLRNGRARPARDLLILGASLGIATWTGIGLRALSVSAANVALVYVLAITIVAYSASRPASVAAALLAMLAFNFFFTEPRYTLTVHDPGYLVTFGAMLVLGLTISGLASQVRTRASEARSRAAANELLYQVSSRLGRAAASRQILLDLHRVMDELVGVEATLFLPGAAAERPAEPIAGAASTDPLAGQAVARALELAEETGSGTSTLPAAEGWYLPLASREGTRFGVLAVARGAGAPGSEQRHLVRIVVAIAVQALERNALAERVRQAAVEVESERLRSDLLAIVSHDLRTPLSSISGAAQAVSIASGAKLSETDRELLRDVTMESERLIRLVENLLQLCRLDDGKARADADWIPVDELIDGALRQVQRTADSSAVAVHVPTEPLLAWADGSLVTQALVNLIENALKYGGASAGVLIEAVRTEGGVELAVLDEGPGFPGDPESLLARFARGRDDRTRAQRGTGLGLAICRAAARAHGGSLAAANRPAGGARVGLFLPDPVTERRPEGIPEEAGP